MRWHGRPARGQRTDSCNGRTCCPPTVRFPDQKGEQMPRRLIQLNLVLSALLLAAPTFAADAKKKVVFVAGKKSHGFGSHDHKAGCHLLAKRLNGSGLPIEAVVVENGWPSDNSVFEGAAAIVVYADGGKGHPANPH